MRDMNDLRYAFGRADDAFIDNVFETLSGLRAGRAGRPRKTYIRLAAAIVILCLLSAGTALALTNTWGILDFLHGRRTNVIVLPEVSEIVQTAVPQNGGETELASFAVREAAFDGHDFYLIVDVKPTSNTFLLLGPDACPEDPAGNMGPLFSGKTGTIADYAEAQGQTMIHTNVCVEGVNGQGADFLLQQDGTLTYMLSGNLIEESDETDLVLTCIIATFENQDGRQVVLMENIKRSSLNITLENTGLSALVSSLAPAEYADCGVRIDSITLKASELAVYTEISYTVIDEAAFAATDEGLYFEFLDTDGNRLPDGAAGGGGTTTEDGVHYVQETAIGAMETLPQEVTVRGFNCWEKNRYETHTFEMR